MAHKLIEWRWQEQARGKFMWRKAFALFKSTHPLPSLSVTSFAVLFGVSSGLSLDQLALVGLAVLTQQFSVGLSNDWLDAARDKSVNRSDKPVAQGIVSVTLVRTASFVSGGVSLAISLTIGTGSFLWMILMLAVGWLYNMGLKSNAFSVFPYIVGFGMLPSFVTLSSQEPSLSPVWVMIVAALFGVAAHFANVLPDLIDDKQNGVRALPHLLGQRISSLVIAFSTTFASILLVSQSKNLNLTIAAIGFGLTLALTLLSSFLALKTKPPKLVFYLLIVATLVNVVMLMLGT
jgi:4-hydroxybenzoate polyprenyltransferase